MAGNATWGPSSGRPPTGNIRVPTRAATSGEASRRWRTNTSTSTAMASPPLLLALCFYGRLEHGLPEHVPDLLHGLRRNGVQCGPQPRAGRHFVRARLVEVQIEPPICGSDCERRPVGPALDIDPLDCPVGVPFPRVARAAGVPRCPPPGFFTNALGRYAGRAGDGCPL